LHLLFPFLASIGSDGGSLENGAQHQPPTSPSRSIVGALGTRAMRHKG
jgi:hypothetical protein